MSDHTEAAARVLVTTNGPYIVSGSLPIAIETIAAGPEGESASWQPGRSIEAGERYALCRCGASSTKPFCDGTHAKIAWDGTETADRGPHSGGPRSVDGSALKLSDDEPLCAWARFCDVGGGIWDLTAKATVQSTEAALAVAEEERCPSGRLVLTERATNAAIEPDLARQVSLVEDGPKACSGPIWLKGGVEVVSQDGTPYAVRNRVTLCRCGASANKPFCDGTHVDIAFQDGLT